MGVVDRALRSSNARLLTFKADLCFNLFLRFLMLDVATPRGELSGTIRDVRSKRSGGVKEGGDVAGDEGGGGGGMGGDGDRRRVGGRGEEGELEGDEEQKREQEEVGRAVRGPGLAQLAREQVGERREGGLARGHVAGRGGGRGGWWMVDGDRREGEGGRRRGWGRWES